MKNIHILGTDNPSRLHWYGDGFFGLSKVYLPWKEGKNIYITNDDEVKPHDYYIKGDEPILAVWVPVSSECKKVIMTTDRDLIRDGIQAIDDEFLEWFIKNPSCDGIEVQDCINYYKILIPQEEPSKVTFEQAVKPLMKWLSENTHPHTTAIVTGNLAELVEGVQVVKTDEFKDKTI
jgi:hypothetical protein